MSKTLRRLVLGAYLLFVMTIFISGCGEKRHKVRVTEEPREGEVIEEGRGAEMIVE